MSGNACNKSLHLFWEVFFELLKLNKGVNFRPSRYFLYIYPLTTRTWKNSP